MVRESRATLLLGLLTVLAIATPASAKAASTTTVPIRLRGSEAPVVIVRVQGKELPLQLDLGDESSLVLHPEVLATLRSEPTGNTAKFFGMDGSFETPIVRLEMVEIGNLKIQGVAARQDTHDDEFRNNKKANVGAVGFIGRGVFKSGQIRLDYSRLTFTISLPNEAGAVKNVCRGWRVPLVANQYGLTTPVTTDLGVLHLGWDTGAPVTLILQSAARAAHLAADLTSTVSKKFEVAGKNFGPQRVEIWNNIPLPPELSGLIGYPFFKEHVLCFDYPKLTLHIQ